MRLILPVLVAVLLSGCGRWAIERQDAETAERIDAQLRIGMSMSEFQAAFPDSRPMGSNGAASQYLVSVQEVCFMCYSGRGFRESTQFFARVVTIEDGALTSIDPLPGGLPK